MEYVVTNVSGRRYQDYIRDTLMKPLGMTSTGTTSPHRHRTAGRSAIAGRTTRGYASRPRGRRLRRDGRCRDGCDSDYARWVAFLLSAWPARDDAQSGPVARATVREIVEGSNFLSASMRPPAISGASCRVARAYAMGWSVANDCDLGRVVSHSGGYPGYGSNVLLLPDRGVGLFAFASRTYAGAAIPVFNAALAMKAMKRLPERTIETGPRVALGYATARAIWAAGHVDGMTDRLAMNVLLDRDAAHWVTELARLRAEVGACPTTEPVVAESAMAGTFVWTCEHGRIKGDFLLAPTASPALQELDLKVATP